MNLNEKKGLKIVEILGAVVFAIGILSNIAEIMEWLGISPKTTPNDKIEISETTISESQVNKDINYIQTEETSIKSTTIPEVTMPKSTSIYINDLDYFASDGGVRNGTSDLILKDNTGELHKRALYVDSMDLKVMYVEYFLNESYTEFKGTCGVAYNNRSDSQTKYFEIIGDGNILYTSPMMAAGSLPEDFSIDITNVKLLRIQYPATYGNNSIATVYDGLLINNVS